MPREAPVTSAHPARPGVVSAGTATSPLDHDGAPDEASAEGAHENTAAGAKTAIADCEVKPQRERRGRRVPEQLDAVDHALPGQPEPLAERAGYAGIGLVVDEQVDVIEGDVRLLDRLEAGFGHPRHRVPVDLGAVHVDPALLVGDP